jgi:hypothetical protein
VCEEIIGRPVTGYNIAYYGNIISITSIIAVTNDGAD